MEAQQPCTYWQPTGAESYSYARSVENVCMFQRPHESPQQQTDSVHIESNSLVEQARSVPFSTRSRRGSFMERLRRKVESGPDLAPKRGGTEKLLAKNVKEMLRQGMSIGEVTKVTEALIGESETPSSNSMDVEETLPGRQISRRQSLVGNKTEMPDGLTRRVNSCDWPMNDFLANNTPYQPPPEENFHRNNSLFLGSDYSSSKNSASTYDAPCNAGNSFILPITNNAFSGVFNDQSRNFPSPTQHHTRQLDSPFTNQCTNFHPSTSSPVMKRHLSYLQQEPYGQQMAELTIGYDRLRFGPEIKKTRKSTS